MRVEFPWGRGRGDGHGVSVSGVSHAPLAESASLCGAVQGDWDSWRGLALATGGCTREPEQKDGAAPLTALLCLRLLEASAGHCCCYGASLALRGQLALRIWRAVGCGPSLE